MPHTGCHCRNCEPGLTGIAPLAGAHHIDREDLELLLRLGLADQARQIAAGTCTDCGLSRATRHHREQCEEPMVPLAPPTPIRQPWEPRPSRRLARAA